MEPTLSVLICSLDERKEMRDKLIESLRAQCSDERLEIIVNSDNREKTIAAKRNELLESANGKYVCFIDDDDCVSDNYVQDILKLVESEPDCVGIEGLITLYGSQYLFKHSIQFNGWYTGMDRVFYRTPNHLNPIKREIALQVKFNQKLNGGEDRDFSDKIRSKLKTEKYLKGPVYIYDPTTWKPELVNESGVEASL